MASCRGQCAGCRGCRQSDYRRPAGDQCAQRPAATRAPARADHGEHRPAGARGVGRCRLLLGSQPPGTEAAAYPGLRGHRPATPRTHRGSRNPSRTERHAHTGHAGQASTRRLSASISTAQADGGARLGHIKQARGFRQVLLRGLSNVAQEWSPALVCLAHNFLKLANALA